MLLRGLQGARPRCSPHRIRRQIEECLEEARKQVMKETKCLAARRLSPARRRGGRSCRRAWCDSARSKSLASSPGWQVLAPPRDRPRAAREEVAVPPRRVHGVALDGAVGVLAAHAGLGQGQQHALGMHEAAERVEIGPHGLGIDDQLVDHVGQRAPARNRARSVASGAITRSTEEWEMSRSCQSATFSSAGTTAGAHQAREAGEVLGEHRVALVRHGGGALLPGAKYSSASRTSVRCRWRISSGEALDASWR